MKMLPPYSPFLNSVEQAISYLKLKPNIKADISGPHIQLRINESEGARNAQLPLGEFRKDILIAAAEKNMHCITVAKCAAWTRHADILALMPCQRTHSGLEIFRSDVKMHYNCCVNRQTHLTKQYFN